MPDDRPQTPHIRGQERADLVDDLAQGELTHDQLAEKYGGRHKQAITQFSMRNKAEIQGRRQVLHGALAEETKHLWVADKVKVAERYQDTIDDLYADFQATEDPRMKSRFARDLAPLLHAAADLYGLFPMRSRIDVEVTRNPFDGVERFVETEDGVLHVVDSQ